MSVNIDHLITALDNEGWFVRMDAVKKLGNIGGDRAVEILIATIEDTNEDEVVQWHAAEALGEIGDKNAVEPLRKAFYDGDDHMKWYAFNASLNMLFDDDRIDILSAALEEGDVAIRRIAADKFGEIMDGATNSLVAALKDDDVIVRRNTARSLQRTWDYWFVEPLMAALKDEDRNVRMIVIETLSELCRCIPGTSQDSALKNKVIVGDLINALEDVDVAVRRSVAALLVNIICLENIDQYDELVRDDSDDKILLFEDGIIPDTLINALEDEDFKVRGLAAVALGKLGDHRAITHLINILGGGNSEVRGYAAETLGEIGDEISIDALKVAIGDEDADVREAASEALIKVRSPKN